MNNVMYIVVNKDLNMSPGKIGAHTAHAVDAYYQSLIEEGLANEYSYGGCDWTKQFETPINFKKNGDTICVLQASQKEMLKFEEQGYIAIRDFGRTEVEPNSLTAINLGIYDKDQSVPKFIQRLRLLKDNDILVVFDMMCEEVFGVYTSREAMLKAFMQFAADNNYEITNSESNTMITLVQKDKNGKVVHNRSFDITSHTLNK